MRISDWSSDVCSSYLTPGELAVHRIQNHEDKARSHAPPVMTVPEGDGCDHAEQGPDGSHHIGRHADARRQPREDQRPFGPEIFGEDVGHALVCAEIARPFGRSEEHTSELQSLMRISYAVFCLKKKKNHNNKQRNE